MPEPAKSVSFPSMNYQSLPAMAKLRIAIHPDATSEWCEYGPDKYYVPVFIKGIFHDIYMGVITNLKATITEPGLQEFIEDNPEAFLGDGFRHIEAGVIFPEEYEDIDQADESLGPLSGHPLSIITETDRTIEKGKIRVGGTRDLYARFFKDYSTFQEFMKLLEGNMVNGINKSLSLIVKAVMCADPTQTLFDDKDIARIFGRTFNNPVPTSPAQKEALLPTRSKQGKQGNTMMRKLIQKYYGKSIRRWPNVKWYNPTFWSYDNDVEEMKKDFTYEKIREGKDKAKRHMQQLYTNAHDEVTLPEGIHHDETIGLTKLGRVDSLLALVDAIIKALIVITTEKSMKYWLGNEVYVQTGKTKSGKERVEQEMREQGTALEGRVVPDSNDDTSAQNLNTSSSYNEGFEVCANPQDLILLLNPEDYADLEIGVARRGQMDVREVNLDRLRSRVGAIYPMRGMKPGHARLLDKRAFKIMPYFQYSDTQAPAEKVAGRVITHYQFAVVMMNLFVGTLFIPSPHFVASPNFYEDRDLLGQTIEKNK